MQQPPRSESTDRYRRIQVNYYLDMEICLDVNAEWGIDEGLAQGKY